MHTTCSHNKLTCDAILHDNAPARTLTGTFIRGPVNLATRCGGGGGGGAVNRQYARVNACKDAFLT